MNISPSCSRIAADWRTLCTDIGERRAGTPEEHRAAEFIAQGFALAGAAVTLESFPCTSLRSARVRVAGRVGKSWQSCEAAALVGAPGTPGHHGVTGELVWLEMPESGHRLIPGSLRGRIAVVFGPLPTEPELHRALVAARPLAVIHVDERLPFAWTKNDGVYPYWVKRYGMPPTVTIPYLTAWQWRRDGIRQARIESSVELVPAESVNVIASLPGAAHDAPELLFTAHHDTQCGNPGADDNASGVVCLLELARLLAPQRRRCGVRLISFGTEEQLSVGSAAYVRRHRRETARFGLIINLDSVASVLGHTVLSCVGPATLGERAVAALAQAGVDVQLDREVSPFFDAFPFNAAGVPSLSLMRRNASGGRWQHHSRHDTLENVSPDPILALVGVLAPWGARLAAAPRWPLPRTIPAAARQVVRRLWRDLYGFPPLAAG